ncbi:putative mitochondrial protein [Tanacetum coccineum]
MLEVDLQMSSAYHPQTDGQTEVVNKTLECCMRCMIGEKPKRMDLVGTRYLVVAILPKESRTTGIQAGVAKLTVLVKMLHGILIKKFKKGILSLLLILEDKDVLKEKVLLAVQFNYNV